LFGCDHDAKIRRFARLCNSKGIATGVITPTKSYLIVFQFINSLFRVPEKRSGKSRAISAGFVRSLLLICSGFAPSLRAITIKIARDSGRIYEQIRQKLRVIPEACFRLAKQRVAPSRARKIYKV